MGDALGITNAVLSPITSLAGGLLSGLIQKKEYARQRDFQREMYDKQVATNRENWSMENMYNSPVMQMQRLKQAGLNPNLIYGNGANAAGGTIDATSTPSAAGGNMPTEAFSNIGNTLNSSLSALYDMRIKQAQANLLTQKATTEPTIRALNVVSAEQRKWEAMRSHTEAKFGRETYDNRIKQFDTTTQQLLATLANTQTNTRVQEAQIPNLQAQTTATVDENVRKWEQQQLTLKQLKQNIVESISRTLINQKQLGFMDAENAKVQSETALNAVRTALESSELDLRKGTGLSHRDPWYSKIPPQIVNSIIDEIRKLFK